MDKENILQELEKKVDEELESVNVYRHQIRRENIQIIKNYFFKRGDINVVIESGTYDIPCLTKIHHAAFSKAKGDD